MKSFIERSGGRIIVDTLKVHGVDTAFCVAGESYLDVLDAFVDTPEINLITCRQEGGASFMAESYGKLTKKPGICFVTRGPGACNASIGVHTAMQDSSPMILFIGQVARDQMSREAFQEINYQQMFAPPFVKWSAQIEQTDRIPEMVGRAFRIATSGRPGPVVLSLPEDMLRETVMINDIKPFVSPNSWPDRDSILQLNDLITSAEKPIVIVGGSEWDDTNSNVLIDIAEKLSLPIVSSFRRQDVFPNKHHCYAGELGTGVNPKLIERIQNSDLIIAIGTRLSEITTQGYSLLKPPQPKQNLVHIHINPEELGKVYTPTVGIASASETFCKIWLQRSPSFASPPAWKEWAEDAHKEYMEWSSIENREEYKLDMNYIFAEIRSKMPEDTIITTDAGNFSCWAQRFIRYGRPGRLLAPTSGAMGYGIPAAISASIQNPTKTVVGMMGDGGAMMNGQELATAIQNGASPILLIFNNSMYGTIRTHQEKNYPSRISATELTNPDFCAWAKSFGADAFQVTENSEFSKVFDKVISYREKPVVIELITDPEQILPNKKLSEL